MVGWLVGCSLNPSLTPSTGSGYRPDPSPTGRGEDAHTLRPDQGNIPSPSGGLSNATQGSVSKPALTPSLTLRQAQGGAPNPTPTGNGELTPTRSPIENGEICEGMVCVFEVAFPFQRPIQPPGTDTVDPTYRYGSTQNGEREVHHGVEFINKAGVPVYAVAEGVVNFAGEDGQVSLATKKGFYGKVIILRHKVAGLASPIYSVYGHVLKILVQKGETVEQGEQIGEVGLGGVAAGTHLHFEVRYGKNEYEATRNPELWLPPAQPDSGVLMGRFLNPQGKCVSMENIVLEPLGIDEALLKRRYFAAYEDPKMHCLPPWGESFGINDLPAGRYRLSYIYTKPETLEFEIVAGKVTYLNLRLP